MRRNRLLIPACLAVGTLLGACGGAQETSDLEVTRVVLYQSGVAYIERVGDFRGEELTIPIRPEQINDILTSMVIVDRNNRSSPSVSLPIDRVDARNVYDLPPELRDAGGMVAMLHALRGAEVTIRGAEGRTRGRVIGVEDIEGETVVTVLANDDTMITMRVADIRRVEVENESVAMAIDASLDLSQSQEQWRPIEVTLHFPDGGNHDLMLAYVVELPIWRPAYRVIIDDDDSLILQGYAVVDNASGEDWNNIELSLTAGTPISFRYDIHSPIYIDRPDLTGYGVPDLAQLQPPNPMEALPGSAPMDQSMYGYGTSDGLTGGGGSNAYGRSMPSTSESYYDYAPEPEEDYWAYDDDAEYWGDEMEEERTSSGWSGTEIYDSGGSSADVTDVGSLFRFDIRDPVTVPDQSSTLVTMVNERIDGENALIYQPWSGDSTHPYRSLLLENSTDYPIQPAPIAIYSDATFVGEGITPAITQGETAFVPYSIEERVNVTMRDNSTTGEVVLARIANGTVYVEQESIYSTTFEVTNSLPEAMRVYLQTTRYWDFDLVEEPEDMRTYPDYYLMPLELEPFESSELTVEQYQLTTTQLDIFSSRFPDVLAVYFSSPDARPDVVAQLEPVRDGLARLAAIDTELDEIRELRADIQVRTQELRSNIAALGESDRNAELRQTLVDRLAEQELIYDDLQAQLVELNEEESALRIEITEMMRLVTLERDTSDTDE